MSRTTSNLAGMRRDYVAEGSESSGELAESDLAASWPAQFGRWLDEAIESGLPEPNAMIVATASAAGRPSARTVLLKGYDKRGFVFYTNHESRKGTEALANPYASLVFPWFAMRRQVVVCGAVAAVSRAEAAQYFATRPRGSQLGAWASPQSAVVPDRATLESDFAAAQQRYPDEVPMPEHWGGFRVAPETVEFWQGRANRLHDRLRYSSTPDGWIIERLAP